MAAERVLVVDDAQGVIDFLSDYVLLPNGYEVLTAMDGEGGLSLALEEKPDLVILDLEMPKMSGMEVLEAFGEKGIDIPVVVITFHGSESIAAEAFRLGVKDYITKPFKMEEILTAIEQALNESRLSTEKAELVKRLEAANQELERRIKEFNILHGIGQAMSSLLGLDDLLTRAIEAAVYVTGAEHTIVHLVDPQTGTIEVGAEQGEWVGGEGDFVERVHDVLQSGRPAIVGATPGDSTTESASTASTNAVLIVPLRTRGDVIGALSVRKTLPLDGDATNDKYLLSVLANYVAIGVENARLYDSLQRRVQQLAVLNEVGQALSSRVDLEQTLNLVMERINIMLKVEAGSLLLIDEESNELAFQIALGEQRKDIKPLRVKVGEGIAGQVAETQQPLLIPHFEQETGAATAIDVSTDFLAKSVLCVPMIARGQTIGVIEVINKLDGTFTDNDLSVLNAIANYAAVAIDNARLFRKFETSRSEREDAGQ